MPDESRTLKAPVVPDAVTAEVITLVKGEVALIKAAILFQRSDRFILVTLAEGLK